MSADEICAIAQAGVKTSPRVVRQFVENGQPG
jgi:hypothetical protein